MKLILVDATNLLLRCAFGGEIPPAEALPIADGMLRRAARECQATHAVLAFDHPDYPSWRRALFDGYKADRREKAAASATPRTPVAEYIALAGGTWSRDGWATLLARGFEADDIIATVVERLRPRFSQRQAVVILSGDSDLQALVTDPAVVVMRPVTGGGFETFDTAAVHAKHGVAPAQLPALKALAGEPGDSIPGPYGKKCEATARKLLEQHGSFAAVLRAEKTMTPDRRVIAERAMQLVTLRTDVPLPPLTPSACGIPKANSSNARAA